MSVPTLSDIEDVIIELLAEDGGQNPADLRAQLAELGPSLPVDSLLAVEVLVRVEQRYRVQLKTDPATAASMQSVTAFAEKVREAIVASSSGVAS